MIHEEMEPVFSASCDNCGKQFEHSFEGWAVWLDKDSMTERMSDQGWHIGDGEEGVDGFCYCDNCHYHDDDDKFHIKEVMPLYQLVNDFPGNKDFQKGEFIRFEKVRGPILQHVIKDCQGERIYTPYFFDQYPYLFKRIQ